MEDPRGRSRKRLPSSDVERLILRRIRRGIRGARKVGSPWADGFRILELCYTDFKDHAFVVVMFFHRSRPGCVFGLEFPVQVIDGQANTVTGGLVLDVLGYAIAGPSDHPNTRLPECAPSDLVTWIPAEVP